MMRSVPKPRRPDSDGLSFWGTPTRPVRSGSGIPREVTVTRLLIAGAVAIALPATAFAHHGWSSYDSGKVLTVTGKFKTVSWANPHGMATMNWNGKLWTVVLAPTARMEARGLTPAMIAPGKVVKIVGYPRRDGSAEMRIERITAGGKTVELR